MKKLLLTGLATSTLFLSGCAHQISNYSPSFDNMSALKGLSAKAKKISLGQFNDPKNTTSLGCRLEGEEALPGNATYVSYLQNALKAELNHSGLYSANSKMKLDATLDNVTSNSMIGTGAHWTIKMTFNDHIQKPYTVKSTYHYSANYVADIACTEAAQAFVPATQQFLKTLYANPNFKKTLQGK